MAVRIVPQASHQAPHGTVCQPVSTVEWVDARTLHANDYNPNRVAAPELRLLKLSILEDGWTQPVVARQDHEIVDGFHRWTLVMTDTDVAALTDGAVPVVYLREVDPAHQRMSTIRHNRARGSHYVLRMADLVHDLIEAGLPDTEIATRLQMEDEEVARLRERGKMTTRGAAAEFAPAWRPAASTEVETRTV